MKVGCIAAAAGWMALVASGAHAQATGPAPAGAATPAGAADPFAVNDPFERVNRRFFAINQVLDRRALRPAAVFYSHAVPRFVRARLRSAFSNLGEPLVIINDALQGHVGTAGRTFTRLAVNSTFGLAGLFDVAAAGGQIPHHDNGFGLTLGRWGVKPGPYLYLLLLGPSDVRDVAGSGVDAALSPLTWTRYPYDYAVGVGSTVLGGLDARAQADGDLKALRALSTDEYASLRSLFLQNRRAQVTGGTVNINALPDFDDPGAEGGAGPVTTPAAPGSVAPTAGALSAPEPALPGAPQGDAGALPSPATPRPDATRPDAAATSPGPQAAAAPAADAPIATMALRIPHAPAPILLASRV